ncbi:MAG TPA: VacJ family lipoprotein [Nitrosospira sp.]|jgi:phospholipid-binding lipoprotein MlaA|nr:VacJ family lipoprotein [Nitrosospira sp.]
MTRTVKPSILLSLLLGFFLNGCATTNKSVTADTNTSATTNAPVNTGTSTSTATSANPAVVNSAAPVSNTPAAAGVSANKSVKADNNRKDAQEPFDGPVFKNAAPAAHPATFRNKEDPWEPVNRKVFGFNETVDDYVFRPLANGYRWVMPDPLQIAVGNVFSNLNDIPVTLNNLLQLKFNNALTSSMRVIVNSTLGLAGVADVATGIGLEKHDEDFGQTLGYHGVASGPYIVLPFLGPSSTRDAGGRVLDIATDPVFVGSFFVAPFIGPIVGSTRATDTRAGLLKSEKTLDEAALDKYEFIRDAYLQRRRSLVHDGNPPKRKEDEDTE